MHNQIQALQCRLTTARKGNTGRPVNMEFIRATDRYCKCGQFDEVQVSIKGRS